MSLIRINGRSSTGLTPADNFRSFWGTWHTIAGYKAIYMIRKGHACWSAAGGMAVLLHRVILN
jgi:hypothetical protein